MTTTIAAPPFTGQDINVAARAVRRLIDVLLAEAGTSFFPFAILNVIDGSGPSVELTALTKRLGTGLDVDESTVLAWLRQLESLGLIRQSRRDGEQRVLVELTAEGVAEQRRLSTIGGQATAQLQSGFSADELATTRRVLTTLSERAAVLLRPSDP